MNVNVEVRQRPNRGPIDLVDLCHIVVVNTASLETGKVTGF